MPNHTCHFEIGCRACTKAADFYSKMFEVGPVPLPNNSEFGWFADPEGNIVGVYAEAKK